jgi:voltage-gated potassium channel
MEVAVTARGRRRLLADLEGWLETPMVILSLIWLGVVILELTGTENAFLTLLAMAIWIVFISEFLLRLSMAPDKSSFLRHNWLTLLALIVPALRLFRAFAIFRAVRLIRGARLVRVVGTVNRSMAALRRTLRRRGFGYVLGLTIAVLLVGAAGMLSFERGGPAHSGLNSYGEAVWWTGMLLSSLGTDYWPQSGEGRALSAMLALYGLAVFGYLTATFASFFIGRDASSPGGDLAGSNEVKRLRREIGELRTLLLATHPTVDAAAPGPPR